jgi:hypothetical protein
MTPFRKLSAGFEWIGEAHRVLKSTGSFHFWGKSGFGEGLGLFKLAD